MKMSDHSLLEVLEAAEFALNKVKNAKLRGCPHGFKDTYAVAAALHVHVYFRSENKGDSDA